MNHTEKCPVCNGTGRVLKFPVIQSTVDGDYQDCPGCNGRCWITISDDELPPSIGMEKAV